MIDIKIFRENPEIIRESEKKRFKDPARVDKVITLDENWRNLLQQVNDLRKARNQISREIGPMKKKGEDFSSLTKRVSDIKKEITQIEEKSSAIPLKLTDLSGCSVIFHSEGYCTLNFSPLYVFNGPVYGAYHPVG